MNSGNAIEVKNVKKKFKVYYDKGSSLKERIIFRARNKHDNRWVLNGISFSVAKGEAVGLIGKNGCGKSTTLKMLTRIMYPTEGTIEMAGRVSSLIELGAGFHPDMSGRENIFINASIFGLNHAEIERRLDDIIKFSELEQFIDNPVRTYSSGMYMRLAFAVAINVDADILLIDEILAVGDVSFQTKCFERLKEIKKNGTTIVIVSHAMSQIEQICDRTIWIENGLIQEEGKPRDVGEHYLASMEETRLKKKEEEFKQEIQERKENQNLNIEKEKNSSSLQDTEKIETKQVKVDHIAKSISRDNASKEVPIFCDVIATRRGDRTVEITNFCILNYKNEDGIIFSTGESMRFIIQYKSDSPHKKVDFRIGISRDDGVHCYGISSYRELRQGIEVDEIGSAELEIEKMPLLPGKYWIDIGIKSVEDIAYDVIHSVRSIQIRETSCVESGISKIPHKWIF